MIVTPRKSVTRFFIPLIDVLILLFAIFLLMPFVSSPTTEEPPSEKEKTPDKPLPTEVKTLQEELKEARIVISRLEKEKLAKLTDRLSVRVLEIDPANGTLFYYDPGREEVRTEADALRLIRKQKEFASKGGVVKDVFFLILYPRKLSGFPKEEQIELYKKWFKDVPFGFDIPSPSF